MNGYEDYIVNTPLSFKLLPEETYTQAKEYGTIISALSEGPMTVKEIYSLYKDPKGKYTKTLKTIYRYLETLEEIKLVMVAGHRKYQGKRTVEKLYARTAKVFFSDDPTHKETWLTTEEGKHHMYMLAELTWRLNDKLGPPPQELVENITTYYRQQQVHVNEMINKTMTDPAFAEAMDKYSLKEIKTALEKVSQIQTSIKNNETVIKLKNTLN